MQKAAWDRIEEPVSMQLVGCDPASMAEAAKLQEGNGAAIIDGRFRTERPSVLVDFDRTVIIPSTWSCRFWPTPGRACFTSMPWRLSSFGSPMPDNWRSCGEMKAPDSPRYEPSLRP